MSHPELLYGSSKPWPRFHPVNDTIRGGKSESSFNVSSSRNVATFSGLLDITALGGAGFASQSTTYSPRLSLPPSTYSGLSLSLSLPTSSHSPKDEEEKFEKPSKPTKFVLILKNTKPPTRPDGRRESVTSYEFEFDVEELGRSGSYEDEKDGRVVVQVEAEWNEFKATYRGRPQPDAPDLDPSDIYELSFMCRSNFGQQAGRFSLDVVSLSAIRYRRRSGGLVDFAKRIWNSIAAWVSEVKTWITRRRDGSVRLE
ncbi:uncharacterized protein JCM6883_005405 [Sporobolomyces salmoneus]|uniref:uncharacterized protein n=1 Tax=Sporobolomyces salmoneus TaxID=183962 RepID=UPI00316B5242